MPESEPPFPFADSEGIVSGVVASSEGMVVGGMLVSGIMGFVVFVGGACPESP
jgi:hypothetical protein